MGAAHGGSLLRWRRGAVHGWALLRGWREWWGQSRGWRVSRRGGVDRLFHHTSRTNLLLITASKLGTPHDNGN